MKRLVSSLLLLLLCLSLCACGGDKETVSMYDLRTAMETAAKDLPEMLSVLSSDEKGEASFGYISDIDYDKVDAYFVSYANGPESYEIAVIAVKDTADISDAEASLKLHRQNRVSFYESYAISEVQRAENAIVFSSGRYAVLIMTDNNSAVKAAFEDFIK